MRIIEAIGMVDALKKNTVSYDLKVRWLSVLDERIKKEIHEQFGTVEPFAGYDEYTSSDTVLLVPSPYDEMYRYWLAAQIDFANGEDDRYNQNMALFSAEWLSYERDYRRSHETERIRPRYF